jgi:kynurenine formamidase
MKMYGDVPVDAAETPAGFTKLGIETVPPLLRRGVLLDVAGWKGEAPLARKYSITADDLRGCAAAQGVQVRAGDVLLVRTGFGTLWNDETAYLQAAGVAKSGTLWAAAQDVVAVGADNMSWDVPEERDPETGATLFGHVYLLPQKGIYIMENLNLEELARARCHSFAFIGIPLKFTGATGSPLRPLALA